MFLCKMHRCVKFFEARRFIIKVMRKYKNDNWRSHISDNVNSTAVDLTESDIQTFYKQFNQEIQRFSIWY